MFQEAYLPTGEGCLSVDDNVAGLVHRHNRITIKAKDIEGNDIQLRLKGYPAIVFNMKSTILNGDASLLLHSKLPLQPHTRCRSLKHIFNYQSLGRKTTCQAFLVQLFRIKTTVKIFNFYQTFYPLI